MTERAVSHSLDERIGSFFTATTSEQLLTTVCALGCEAAGAVGVAVLCRHQGNVRKVATFPDIPMEEGQAQPPSWLVELAKAYGQTLAETPQILMLSSGPGEAHGVYVPLFSGEHGSFSLAAYVLGGRALRLQSVKDILLLVRASFFLAEKNLQQSHAPTQATMSDGGTTLLDVVDTISEIQACTRFFEACTTVCATIAEKFACRRVALGLCKDRQVKAVALDQMESFSRGTRSVRQLEEVMQEAFDQNRMILYGDNEDQISVEGGITRAARELAQTTNATCVLSLPLRQSEGVRFILVAVMDHKKLSARELDALSLVCRLAAPRLRDLELAEEFPLKKTWRYILLKSSDIFGPRRTALKLASTLLGVFLIISLLVRGDVIVSAPLVIEGVHSYTHTAPMDSFLYEVFARPGDGVKKGDLLGRLNPVEIELEISGLEAQKNIQASQADQYLQEGKDAEMAIARLEAERIAANLAWAEERLGMTELRSSVDGFVISEDMYPRLGQPVRRGQELFEITDTASMRVVVHVDEIDISDVNMTKAKGPVRGEFTLTAYPDLHIPFMVERIHPYATVTNAVNGFEVRGTIESSTPQGLVFRPGMEGHARIVAGEKPLLALWTRKLVNKIRLMWWKLF